MQEVRAQAWRWAIAAHTTSGFYQQNICRDSLGNIYLTGQFNDSLVVGQTYLTTSAVGSIGTGRARGGHPFVAKINGSTGQWEWIRRIESSTTAANFYITGFAGNASGDVYMAGHIASGSGVPVTGGITFGSHVLTGLSGRMGFLAKLSAAGDWEWARSYTNTDYNGARVSALAVDRSGNPVIAGYFGGMHLNLGFSVLTNTNSSGASASSGFVAKYSASGTGVWATAMPVDISSTPSVIALDSIGDVFLSGIATDSMRIGSHIATGSYGCHSYITRLSSDGLQWQWLKLLPRDCSGGYSHCVAVDDAGNLCISSKYSFLQAQAGVLLDTITVPADSGNYEQQFIGLLSVQGDWKWAIVPGRFDKVRVEHIALRKGVAFVSGCFLASGDVFGTVPVTLRDSSQAFVAKLTEGTGQPHWVVPINGHAYSIGRMALPTASGDLFLTGNFQHTIELGSWQLQQTAGMYPLTNLFVSRLQVNNPQYLLGFAPAYGAVGQIVMLAASEFVGVRAVYFNGTPARGFTQPAVGALVVEVPAGAVTGRITVETAQGVRTSESDFIVTSPTGLEVSHTTAAWQIWPNPVTDNVVHISCLQLPAQPVDAVLRDMRGSEIRHWRLLQADQSIDLHGLLSGVYSLFVNGECKRLIVMNE